MPRSRAVKKTIEESYHHLQDLFLTVLLAASPTNRRVIVIARVKEVLAKP